MSLPPTWRDGDQVEPPYFFGVYDRAGIEPWDRDDPFASAGWIEHCATYARSLGLGDPGRSSARALRSPSVRSLARRLLGREHPRHLRHPIAIVKRALAEAGSIRVLDVGGGFGDNFALLTRALPEEMADRIDYCIVDNGPSIELGRSLYATQRVKPRFSSTLPEEPSDLVLAIGVLQYVPDWRSMCASLLAAGRRDVFITRSPLTLEAPTFFTIQSVCPTMGPFAGRQVGLARSAVINKRELETAMSRDGWRLTHDETLEDYSSHFSRLPKPYDRGIVYAALCWSADRPAARS